MSVARFVSFCSFPGPCFGASGDSVIPGLKEGGHASALRTGVLWGAGSILFSITEKNGKATHDDTSVAEGSIGDSLPREMRSRNRPVFGADMADRPVSGPPLARFPSAVTRAGARPDFTRPPRTRPRLEPARECALRPGH
jgi:hypothetical protein